MPLARIVAKACKWPLFLYSVLLLYWSVAFVALSYHISWLRLCGRRNDVLGWSSGTKWWMRARVLKAGKADLYRKDCVYLFNHRSWGDFIVDQYATEGRSMFMSRLAVLGVFPTFVGSLVILRSIILFKRGAIQDKERFNAWIDAQRAASPQTGLAVYPEGHRSVRDEPLPLKRGMLYYAFSRKLPVQVVIGANKEAIIAEKHCTARLGQTAVVGYSEVIRTADYADFESFWAAVQAAWDAEWREVFGADWAGLPELQPQAPDTRYPLSVTLSMLGMVLLNFGLAGYAALLTFRAARWAFALFGAAQPLALAIAAAYLALSVWLYSQPVNALEVHRQSQRPGKLAASTASLDQLDGSGGADGSGSKAKQR